VERIEHVAPDAHPDFYARSRFTLNVTRADMARVGFSPSVRLFEAAACGCPILSDTWQGLETLFEPGLEIELVETPDAVLRLLREADPVRRQGWIAAARGRVLAAHTAEHRAAELEQAIKSVSGGARQPVFA
jgi:spore maturation protein CgeB